MDRTVVILQFLQITLFVLLPGLLVGGGLGFFFGWLFKLLYQAAPKLRPPFMLFPWRTVLLALVIATCTPVLFYLLGPDQAFSPVLPSAITFLLLVFCLVIELLLNRWLPTGLGVRLTGLLRTLAVLCLALVLVGSDAVPALHGVDQSQYSILRFLQMEMARSFKVESLWVMLGIVLGLGLALDLLLGVVQMLFDLVGGRKAKKAPLEAVG